MTRERWARVKALFHAAAERPLSERNAFLTGATVGDDSLRREVESLLAQDDSSSFLERPLAADASSLARDIELAALEPRDVLAPGQRLGHYEILELLGAGAMGEVYRSRDTKLNRDVAVKVIPAVGSMNPERLARFRREAQLLALVNHPNVAALYGVEETSGQPALVLELVTGPTLGARLARGPLLVSEALRIARQIAAGLEAAHQQGIIHRDLKPSNIHVRPDGVVKILDFGLAKSLVPEGQVLDAAHGESHAADGVAATREGMILGTAAYMSPEQARGQALDTRGDIWSFGCVLFEMLAGRPPFHGETVTDLLAAVVKDDPDWSTLPAEVPAGIRTLLQRCLRKDPRQRLQAIGDARLEIDDALAAGVTAESGPPLARFERHFWLALVVILAVVAVGGLVRGRQSPSMPQETRLDVATPPTTDPASMAISPDGAKIVFSAVNADGQAQLWTRVLTDVMPRPVPSTENARYPFWSPDGRSIGFFANGRLKRVDSEGGSLRDVADAPLGLGGTWSRDDTIVFAPNWVGPLVRVSASGGPASPATRLADGQTGHRFPQFLPDGRHVLFETIEGGGISGVIYVADIRSGESHRLIESGSGVSYAPSGHVLYARGAPAAATLMAQRFDPDRLSLIDKAFPVAASVTVGLEPGSAALSVAAGLIAYRADAGAGVRQLAWFDRAGNLLATVGDPDRASPVNPALSPDGRSIAVRRAVGENADIWLVDSRTGLLGRLTASVGLHNFPVWSPDGRFVAFTANLNRGGVNDFYRKAADGSGDEELMLATPQNKGLADWSSDGRYLLFRSVDPRTGNDLWAASVADGTSFVVAQTTFDERDGQFSPDTRWIAYQSNETGTFEIWVRAFPGPGDRVRVSTGGGTQARWRPDGKELFYIAMDGRLMAVPLTFSAQGQSIEPGTPVPLFATRIGGALQGFNRHQYAVAPDGQRFLMNTVTPKETMTITLIQHWRPGP